MVRLLSTTSPGGEIGTVGANMVVRLNVWRDARGGSISCRFVLRLEGVGKAWGS